MKKILLLCVSLMLVSCASDSLLKPKAASALNIKNLEKNPVSGFYSVKSSMGKLNSPQTISKGLIVKEKPKVISETIPSPVSASEVSNKSDIEVHSIKEGSLEFSQEKASEQTFRVDWLKLSLYYLVAIYILAMVYVTYRKGYFIEIKNPFKKEIKPVKANPKKVKTKRIGRRRV